jgi:hypothetical protein
MGNAARSRQPAESSVNVTEAGRRKADPIFDPRARKLRDEPV